jgi:serine/threonine protein kinase
MADYIGQQYGNYRLVKLLGEGGFAEVYLGEHVHLGLPAAVKVLSTKLTSEGIAIFREEARTIISLEHPNIVRVHDFGMHDGIPYIVMNYAPNGSLRILHPKGTRLPLEKIVSYVKQIAAALKYAHERKLIHRDIKPDNMLLGHNNEVLLSDFGIAVIAHSTRSLNTQDGSGTLYYMAPEQIQGKPRIASDQYALGIVVYEWLNGRPPFMGTAAEIGMQHLLTPPPSFHINVPQISYAVEQVVMRALDKDPKQRFESVQAFAIALEQVTQPLQSASTLIPEDQSPLLDTKATPSSQLRILSVSTDLTESPHQLELTPIAETPTDSPNQTAIPTASLISQNQPTLPPLNETLFVKHNPLLHPFNVSSSANQLQKNPVSVKMQEVPNPRFSLSNSLKNLLRIQPANMTRIPQITTFTHRKNKPSLQTKIFAIIIIVLLVISAITYLGYQTLTAPSVTVNFSSLAHTISQIYTIKADPTIQTSNLDTKSIPIRPLSITDQSSLTGPTTGGGRLHIRDWDCQLRLSTRGQSE